MGLVSVVAKLLLLPLGNEPSAYVLIGVLDLALSLLIAMAAWQASRRSLFFARVLWLCAGFVALIWALHFASDIILLKSGAFKTFPNAPFPNAPLPALFITAFPFAVALTLPLLLREDQKKLEISWRQTLDIAQLGIIVFSAFLAFFYLPFLKIPSDPERGRYLMIMHLTRDGFLALGYLYRGWRSSFPDLRRLHFRVSGFLAAYGLSPLLISHGMNAWHWPEALAGFVADLPALFLLATAASWQQEESPMRTAPTPESRKSLLWTQVLPLAMPVSVLALASRMPVPYLRGAWIMVTASFALYAARLFLMQHQQNQTLSSLHAMEEKFSKAFRSSPVAMNISRFSDGRLVDANDRWFELTQLCREDAIGKTTVELGLFENVKERDRLMEILREQHSIKGLGLEFRVEGRTFTALVSAELVEIGNETMVLVSALDTTELKNVTRQLQQAQKMELVGSLAGGIAHDFNNLLTIITGNAALALTMELDADLAEHIRQIKEASGRAASLTRQLLAFSRRQTLQPRSISLNSVVASIETLLRRTITQNITLATSYAPDLGTVHADPVQIEQVVMNLAVNARDAMPQGGKLYIETRNLDLTLLNVEKEMQIPQGRYIMLSVTDTGTGIRPEDMDRIFEPFFTTKAVGTGTGLGLSTVYGIVKQSGGHIRVYSDLGRGTTFKICLPRVDSPAETVRTAPTESENLNGNETVLVVDDDARVCELTAKILGRYGYQVITANSAEDAEHRAQDFDAEIHLLVTDIVMPGTNGRALAQQLKSKRPKMKVLYLSGYPRMTQSSENGAGADELLFKPFAPTELARRTRRALRA
jgi:PAS domain S-box-containing protein